MPILRHECTACGVEVVALRRTSEGDPEHCGQAMRLLMPRHVVGRVVADSNGVHTGSGFAASKASPHAEPWADARVEVADKEHKAEFDLAQLGGDTAASFRPEQGKAVPIDPDDPFAVPAATGGLFDKDYADCTAAERDERWRDTAQALAASTTRQLESKGADPTKARSFANIESQRVMERSRAAENRDDCTA